MDWASVVPALLDGIDQELGLEAKEVKFVLVANQHQIDPKPFQHIFQQYHDLEWEVQAFQRMQNPEPFLEIQLRGDASTHQVLGWHRR